MESQGCGWRDNIAEPWLLPQSEQKWIARHVLIHYTNQYGHPARIIPQYVDVIRAHGAVWYAKTGKPMGDKSMRTIQSQLAAGIETNLYLVNKRGANARSIIHQALVTELSSVLPEPDRHLVPAYYSKTIIDQSSLWIKAAFIEECTPDILDRLHIAISGQTMSEAISRVRSSLVLVRKGKGIVL